LRANSFRQGEDNAPTDGHDEEHASDLPKSKYVHEKTARRSRAVFLGFVQQEQQYSHLDYLING